MSANLDSCRIRSKLLIRGFVRRFSPCRQHMGGLIDVHIISLSNMYWLKQKLQLIQLTDTRYPFLAMPNGVCTSPKPDIPLVDWPE